jgi:hypothetical protein
MFVGRAPLLPAQTLATVVQRLNSGHARPAESWRIPILFGPDLTRNAPFGTGQPGKRLRNWGGLRSIRASLSAFLKSPKRRPPSGDYVVPWFP